MLAAMQQVHAAPPDRDYRSYADFFGQSKYAEQEHEQRASGRIVGSMIRHLGEPADFIEAATPDISICAERRFDLPGHSRDRELLIDVGDGRKRWGNPEPGTLHIQPSGAEGRYTVDYEYELMVCSIPASRVHAQLDESGVGATALEHHYGKVSVQHRARSTMAELWRAMAAPQVTASLYSDGLALELLSILAGDDALSPLGLARPEDRRIRRALEYAEARLGSALSIGELATVASLSEAYFARAFKASMGMSVWSYVQHRRCERAKAMLEAGKGSIAQIAHECGFASQAHLTSVFKQAYGITPGETASFRDS